MRVRSAEAKNKLVLTLKNISAPASQQPLKFEAQRVLRAIEKGVITILSGERISASGPSVKLIQFPCKYDGSHVNPVILMDVSQIERIDAAGLIPDTVSLLGAFRKLREGEEIARGNHHRGFCRNEVGQFAQRKGLLLV